MIGVQTNQSSPRAMRTPTAGGQATMGRTTTSGVMGMSYLQTNSLLPQYKTP